jgi:phage FluMu protein Com
MLIQKNFHVSYALIQTIGNGIYKDMYQDIKCQHCDKKFKSQLRCNDHETAVHKPDFEGFKCPQCPEILAFSTCLQRHIQKFHQE